MNDNSINNEHRLAILAAVRRHGWRYKLIRKFKFGESLSQIAKLIKEPKLEWILDGTNEIAPSEWKSNDEIVLIRYYQKSIFPWRSDGLIVVNDTQNHASIWERSAFFGKRIIHPWAFQRQSLEQILLIQDCESAVLVWNLSGLKNPIPFHLPANKIAKWVVKHCWTGVFDTNIVSALNETLRRTIQYVEVS
jgi:hypothetical protein